MRMLVKSRDILVTLINKADYHGTTPGLKPPYLKCKHLQSRNRKCQSDIGSIKDIHAGNSSKFDW